MKFLLPFILSLALTTQAPAKTLIFPVKDLLMEIPTFNNAPDFNFAFNGQSPIGNSQPAFRKSRKQREQELIDLFWELYPDAQSIAIYNGNLIVKITPQ